MQPRLKPIVQEDRKLATFVVEQYIFHDDKGKLKLNPNEYQGWCNSASWCFNLYFMQEADLQNELERLIRKDRTINYDRAIRLFDQAQRFNRMEQIDADCEGSVNVREIVDHFLNERRQDGRI